MRRSGWSVLGICLLTLCILLTSCSGGVSTQESATNSADLGQTTLLTPTSTVSDAVDAATTPSTTISNEIVTAEEQLVEVPNLVGQTIDYAQGVLSVIGLALVVDSSQESDDEPGVIFKQLPEAGEETTPGSPVVAWVPTDDLML